MRSTLIRDYQVHNLRKYWFFTFVTQFWFTLNNCGFTFRESASTFQNKNCGGARQRSIWDIVLSLFHDNSCNHSIEYYCGCGFGCRLLIFCVFFLAEYFGLFVFTIVLLRCFFCYLLWMSGIFATYPRFSANVRSVILCRRAMKCIRFYTVVKEFSM